MNITRLTQIHKYTLSSKTTRRVTTGKTAANITLLPWCRLVAFPAGRFSCARAQSHPFHSSCSQQLWLTFSLDIGTIFFRFSWEAPTYQTGCFSSSVETVFVWRKWSANWKSRSSLPFERTKRDIQRRSNPESKQKSWNLQIRGQCKEEHLTSCATADQTDRGW